MRLDLEIDPATLPTAQQKGVTRDGRVYTKAKVLRAKRRLVEALVEASYRARNRIEVESGTLAVRRIWEARDSGAPWSVAIEYVYSLRTTPRRVAGFPKPTRPDLDNLTKLVLDAMTEAGCFFADDAQVVTLATLKRHALRGVGSWDSEPAHITVWVRPLGSDELDSYSHHWRNGNEKRV